MKTTIFLIAFCSSIILTAFVASPPSATTPMGYNTLGGTINKNTVDPTGKGWKFGAFVWFGVSGNKYTKRQSSGEWTGFVEKIYIPVIIASKLDTAIMNTAMIDSANAYRLRKYPNVK